MTDTPSTGSTDQTSLIVRCIQSVKTELKEGGSIICLVESLITHAYCVRASDIHIDPSATQIDVRFRIDGVLEDAHVFPLHMHSEVIARLKILCGLRTDEHQAAQDGRFRLIVADGQSVDVRVSIVPVYYGENAVLRLLVGETELFTLQKLGFTPVNEAKIVTALRKPYGMILATGPTGSGKTTTLYTLIKMLHTKESSIITIEDPIEYAIAGINQIQVNTRTGLTFANGLRSMLRQDPNTIMVGEIRDIETAGLAVNIALTGHLVLSTLHTNDAATTLPRLLDLRVEPYLISSTVNIAIGQRLVRRLCPACKQPKKLSLVEVSSLHQYVATPEVSLGSTVWAPVGCVQCNQTGYQGRIGIHEVLVLTPRLREGVLRQASAGTLRTLAVEEGMVPLIEDGFHKVLQGFTTIEEILKMHYE